MDEINWEFQDATNLAGIQFVDGQWQVYVESAEYGQSQVDGISEADVQRLYETLKKRFES